MTIILFVITLSILILIHEWGHFYAAKKFRVRVDEFGFGFPPKIASTFKNGTQYVLNLFPIGGYVKIYGEGGEGKGEKHSFASKPVWQRALIVAAGVIMNMVLAWVLLTGSHLVGISQVVKDGESTEGANVTIIAVEKDSPAEQAGIKFGDSVKMFVTKDTYYNVHTIEILQQFISLHAGEEIGLILERNGETRPIVVRPRENPPEGSGPLGIALDYVKIEKSPWYRAPWDGLKSTYIATKNIFIGFGEVIRNLVTEQKVPQELSGPVGVFMFTKDISELGLSYFFQFISILSINLAILNLLPIPALDGGRLLFLAIEKVRGRPVHQKFEGAAHAIGFFLLILLMILVTVRDIRNLF